MSMITLAPVPTTFAPAGMVCAVDHLAAHAGVAALRQGGSAADAAVAASAVLAVTSQHMCGMGGDLVAVIGGDGRPPTALNASGRAGSGADPDRLRAEGYGSLPVSGDIRSAPVPGCVDGWLALHARYGRLDLLDLLAPAIAYARDGFPATPSLAAAAGRVAELPGGEAFRHATRPGALVRRPGVARTLEAVATRGREGFYGGEFGAGLLALGAGEYLSQDLASPLAEWVPPLSIEAWGRQLWTAPPNCQGYLTLAASWLANGLDLPAEPEDPQWAHLLIEASRAVAWDRDDVLHERADGAALLAPDRLAASRSTIDPMRAAKLGDAYRPGGTIAVCAVDANRLAVSLLQSNATGFGCGIAEPATGIFLHNRGIGFCLEPGHPAEYGPGRRPPHTLCPTLATTSGLRFDLVAGTMGGDAQPQILLQLLARVLAAGETPAEALAAGRWVLSDRAGRPGFTAWRDRGKVQVDVEGHAPDGWLAGLAERGHVVCRQPAYAHAFGHAQVIRSAGGMLEGASDARALARAAFGLRRGCPVHATRRQRRRRGSLSGHPGARPAPAMVRRYCPRCPITLVTPGRRRTRQRGTSVTVRRPRSGAGCPTLSWWRRPAGLSPDELWTRVAAKERTPSGSRDEAGKWSGWTSPASPLNAPLATPTAPARKWPEGSSGARPTSSPSRPRKSPSTWSACSSCSCRRSRAPPSSEGSSPRSDRAGRC
jgi:gamma-glutamyltranspeptidase/glutathione hydrolase